eukprot:TRINITY_DN4164_c2_g2_i3.p5 TRINITY_DN4164_c2_g2~~TRINITY_DN4164_c2_g2_i3.p5  ORF type:complete len:204 (+),score=-21.79 TRINITY_DN4164_c2_g2_i3:1460-2071(+)
MKIRIYTHQYTEHNMHGLASSFKQIRLPLPLYEYSNQLIQKTSSLYKFPNTQQYAGILQIQEYLPNPVPKCLKLKPRINDGTVILKHTACSIKLYKVIITVTHSILNSSSQTIDKIYHYHLVFVNKLDQLITEQVYKKFCDIFSLTSVASIRWFTHIFIYINKHIRCKQYTQTDSQVYTKPTRLPKAPTQIIIGRLRILKYSI